jgi:peptidoglycan/LPS O-acetylase OafA/YrhL
MRYIREDLHHVRTIVLVYALVVALGLLLALTVPVGAPRIIVSGLVLLGAIPATIWCQYWRSDEGDPHRHELITPIAITVGLGSVAFYLFNWLFMFGCINPFAVFVGGCAATFGLCYAATRIAEPLLQRVRQFVPEGDYHICMKCGYDLTGNVSGRCPECGTSRTCPRCGRSAEYFRDGMCAHCGYALGGTVERAFDEGSRLR